jgi:hypothetical protein
MSFTIHPCHARTVMVAAGCYLLGAGELAITDIQTLLGAAGPISATLWKFLEHRHATTEAPHG